MIALRDTKGGIIGETSLFVHVKITRGLSGTATAGDGDDSQRDSAWTDTASDPAGPRPAIDGSSELSSDLYKD